jgi:hypothetical protein
VSDRPTWFEDVEDEPSRPRRRLLSILAAVAVTWLVVSLALLGRGAPAEAPAEPLAHQLDPDTTSPGDAGRSTAAGDDLDPAPDDAADREAVPAVDGGPEDRATGPGHGPDVGHDEAAAVVAAVVRGWLSDGGPDLAIPGLDVDRRAYLEHLSVERFDLPGPELAVARTLLVLLVREGDHYTEAVLRRAAVPLTLTEDGALPAGPPWWLPDDPELAVTAPPTEPLDEPELALEVLEAIEAAGYRGVSVAAVARTATGALVADIEATTPNGDPVAGPVWLLTSADGALVLAGAARAPGATSDTTNQRPTD